MEATQTTLFGDTAFYEVLSRGAEWFVVHDGQTAGPYLTKQAAFEASIGPISLAVADGLSVRLDIRGGQNLVEP